MANRKQDAGVAETVNAPSQSEAPTVNLTPPTEDEEKYLRSIEQSNSNYDPGIILGGPRVVRP
jgi:hypothetical protein